MLSSVILKSDNIWINNNVVYDLVHPCSKVIGIFFCNVKWWYVFSLYSFEIFLVAWRDLLHLSWKTSWVYVTASCLCEHSNSVRFEKRAAKMPQHGLRYGNMINTYEWFFCFSWHEFCSCNKLSDFSFIYCFLVKYAIYISNMNKLLPHYFLCWYATSSAGELRAGTSSYWVMPSNTAISNFSIFLDFGPRQN